MKFSGRLLRVLFSIFISLGFIPLPAFSEAQNNGGETLVVGVPSDRCPVFYIDRKTKQITGIGVDLMKAAAKNAGFNATFKIIEEKTLKDALDSDKYDVILPFGSAVPSSSGKATVVSENLMRTPFTLVTGEKYSISSINSLRVGMLSSLGAGAETIKGLFPTIKILMYESMDDCVKALRKNEVDALLHNSYVWSYVLQKPSYEDLEVNPLSMFSMDFRAGTQDSPNGRAIIERLNEGINAMPLTIRQAIVLGYTSRQLYVYDFSDYLYKYGLVIFLSILLLILLCVVIILKMRTIRLKEEKKIRSLIDYDSLTGVLSLTGFRKRVTELLLSNPDIPYLLAYINIKNFKYINDSLGMDSGDNLLCFLIDTVGATLSEDEAICRLANDHFAVLRRADEARKGEVGDAAVIDIVRNFFIDRGKENRVQICCGVYILEPKDYIQIDVNHMLDFARVAEKRVRETRNDGFEYYNPEQWEKGRHTTEVLNHLPPALKAGDIKVWYQPQVDYETGEITGAEALCRWNHDKLGWLQPEDFITTLEETGLIFDLDCFVWDRVCQDLHRWNEQGLHRQVSVNVSRNDIQEDRGVPSHFGELIKKYNLSPDQLRIEITETAFVENPEILINATAKLQELGFQVEMYDFGSGYSSLNMLKEVPLNRIKLDLRFLTGSGDPKKGRTIVRYMVKMIHALGMKMIAEGVETAEQADFLKTNGCNEMQGYYFHKPMSCDDFEKLMSKN